MGLTGKGYLLLEPNPQSPRGKWGRGPGGIRPRNEPRAEFGSISRRIQPGEHSSRSVSWDAGLGHRAGSFRRRSPALVLEATARAPAPSAFHEPDTTTRTHGADHARAGRARAPGPRGHE